MTSSLRKDPNPCQRSNGVTPAHNIPTSPNPTSNPGNPPAAVVNSRRRSVQLSVGIKANSQATIKMLVAEVDHGSDTATATARTSEKRAKRARSIYGVASTMAQPAAFVPPPDVSADRPF